MPWMLLLSLLLTLLQYLWMRRKRGEPLTPLQADKLKRLLTRFEGVKQLAAFYGIVPDAVTDVEELIHKAASEDD